ncbi:hypothetical protein E5Q_06635 [Mixia osmundae IAM 14324]|uniref:Kinesin motor domain-containing protein n=1 Tax=Mixia osmundae (strain CBS 9802 / IAM 14324 / JCM 22182 / KY 12970) TaxID=764103 RepID=G7EAS2_MIXOS|nr:hypothetical protein E5Q_06635 [Mixia osmundae IAM 14324]
MAIPAAANGLTSPVRGSALPRPVSIMSASSASSSGLVQAATTLTSPSMSTTSTFATAGAETPLNSTRASSPSALLPSPALKSGSAAPSMARAMTSAGGTSVQVILRVRPAIVESANFAHTPSRQDRVVVYPLPGATSLTVDATPVSATSAVTSSPLSSARSSGLTSAAGPPKQSFTFDRVLGPESSQTDVFATFEHLIDFFLQGYNVTVLAYGQTASGKSFTMGTEDKPMSELVSDHAGLGLVPRAVRAIFDRIAELRATTRPKDSFQIKNSYIELYNEDMIDLLSGDIPASERQPVTIREEKGGGIKWTGLRELRVNNVLDVMSNLERGSAIRQTGATQLNSQSSRSHAIFSLTLTQRKWVPNESSRNEATDSPTRPSSRTSHASSSNRGLRSGSMTRASLIDDEDEGEQEAGGSYVVVTSKLHFADLAGSERLKNTAATGDRAKEGISINSGLHALGNVISALGDPAKARQITHVPYRDSKLTRLLQDSLGGNAHTMMIACISGTERNLPESLNTLKYANRARNIKNKAELNEIEEGWEDVEWLQKTVRRLRADLADLKSGRPLSSGSAFDALPTREMPDPAMRALQQEVEMLSQKYAKATSDLAQQQNTPQQTPDLLSSAFSDSIAPIVDEFERALSTTEAQLAAVRAQLAAAESQLKEQRALNASQASRIDASEAATEAVRTRLAKLIEREAVTEAYVQDLEGKLKDISDRTDTDSSVVVGLRNELAGHRESQMTTEKYINELETRLTKSGQSNEGLLKRIEELEASLEERVASYRLLEHRLSGQQPSQQVQALTKELESKNALLLVMQSNVARSLPAPNTPTAARDLPDSPATPIQGTSVSHDGLSALTGARPATPDNLSTSPSARDGASSPHRLGSLSRQSRRSSSTASASPQRPFLSNRPSGSSLRDTATSQPLSLELSSAQHSRSLLSPDRSVSPALPPRTPPPRSPARQRSFGKMNSDTDEIQRLQGIIRARDVDIQSMDRQIQALRTRHRRSDSSSASDAAETLPVSASTTPEPGEESQTLSPGFTRQIEAFKLQPPATESAEAHAARLDDVMRSMARKEANHRDTVEELTRQLHVAQRSLVEAETLRQSAEQNFAGEFKGHSDRLVESTSRAATLEQSLDQQRSEHAAERDELTKTHSDSIVALTQQHQQSHATLVAEHEQRLTDLTLTHDRALHATRKEHEQILSDAATTHDQRLAAALAERTMTLKADHARQISEMNAAHDQARSQQAAQHDSALAARHEATEAKVVALQTTHETAISDMKREHAAVLESQANAHAAALQEYAIGLEKAHALAQQHEETARVAQNAEQDLQSQMKTISEQNSQLSVELENSGEELRQLRADFARLSSDRESLAVASIRSHGSVKSMRRRSGLNGLGLGESPDPLTSPIRVRAGSNHDAPWGEAPTSPLPATPDETKVQMRAAALSALTSSPSESPRSQTPVNAALSIFLTGKPPAPPPMQALPPTPAQAPLPSVMENGRALQSGISTPPPSDRRRVTSSTMYTPGGRRTSYMEGPMSIEDDMLESALNQRIETLETQILGLNKQLTHCEADLSANIDLVNTLESSLDDSDRNLRKARLQMSELAKDRDRHLSRSEKLGLELAQATQEIDRLHNNLAALKDEAETSAAQERQAKIEAKQQLQSRLESIKHKKSKFNCF